MKIPFLFALLLTALPASADKITLEVDPLGVAINAGDSGRYIIEAPTLMEDGHSPGPKPAITAKDDGSGYVGKYEGGFQVDVNVSKTDNTITYSFTTPPATAHFLVFYMSVPYSLVGVGKVGLEGQTPKLIPVDKGTQFVVDGSVGEFDLLGANGHGFSLKEPMAWQCLQDNRVFNDNSFVWNYNFDLKASQDKNIIFRVGEL